MDALADASRRPTDHFLAPRFLQAPRSASGGDFGVSVNPPVNRCAMQDANPTVVKLPEFPMVDIPKLEAGAAEATAAFREYAERGLSQAKDAYAKMKTAAEEATGILETTYANASKGASDYGLKMVEVARANSNATFDFAAELLGARTFAQVVEVSTAHTRKQIEAWTEQAKELTTLAQKVATHTAEPIKDGFSSLVRKAA
jgi:phasin